MLWRASVWRMDILISVPSTNTGSPVGLRITDDLALGDGRSLKVSLRLLAVPNDYVGNLSRFCPLIHLRVSLVSVAKGRAVSDVGLYPRLFGSVFQNKQTWRMHSKDNFQELYQHQSKVHQHIFFN